MLVIFVNRHLKATTVQFFKSTLWLEACNSFQGEYYLYVTRSLLLIILHDLYAGCIVTLRRIKIDKKYFIHEFTDIFIPFLLLIPLSHVP